MTTTTPPLPPSARTVPCPTCGKAVAWVTENRERPFCSARCKSIDFGAWAAEEYRLAGQEKPAADVTE